MLIRPLFQNVGSFLSVREKCCLSRLDAQSYAWSSDSWFLTLWEDLCHREFNVLLRNNENSNARALFKHLWLMRAFKAQTDPNISTNIIKGAKAAEISRDETDGTFEERRGQKDKQQRHLLRRSAIYLKRSSIENLKNPYGRGRKFQAQTSE